MLKKVFAKVALAQTLKSYLTKTIHVCIYLRNEPGDIFFPIPSTVPKDFHAYEGAKHKTATTA